MLFDSLWSLGAGRGQGGLVGRFLLVVPDGWLGFAEELRLGVVFRFSFLLAFLSVDGLGEGRRRFLDKWLGVTPAPSSFGLGGLLTY